MALVLLAVLAAVGVSEIVVAIWLPFGVPLLRLDEELLHTTVPGARRVRMLHRQGRRLVEVSLDPRGLRGVDRSPVPDSRDAFRLAVYGDSLVLAESAKEEETFVRQLELVLRREVPSIELFNAGVTGYGPDQALLKFQREHAELRPDAALLVLCAHNDHGDLLRNKLYRIEENGELRRQKPKLSARVIEQFERAGRAAEGWALERAYRVWTRAVVDPPLVDLPARWLAACRFEEQSFHAGDIVEGLLEDTYDLDLALGLELAETKRQLMRGVLGEWWRAAEERQVELYAVVVPSAIGLDPSFALKLDADLFPDHDAGRISAALDSGLEAAGIPALNLRERMDESTLSQFFIGGLDFHWSLAGQAFAAREVAAFLQDRGWPPSARTNSSGPR